MIKLDWNKIISLMVFTVFFSGLVYLVDFTVYKLLPFNYFLHYTNIQRSDICVGDTTQELLVERIVRKNIAATITSELFLVRNDPERFISDANIKVHQEKFDIIYDVNELQAELIQVQLPELKVGNYYWLELTTIKLPKGISKSKILEPQYFNVNNCE